MHLNLVTRLVVVWTLVACAVAFPSPTTPVGDTVWNVGDDVEIRWRDSGTDPKSDTLSGISIYFMTGPNIGQIKLTAIAEKLDKNVTSTQWTVPALKTFGYPAGNIYFIMFTDSKDPDVGISWSTRFRVLDGSKEVQYDPDDPFPYQPGNSSDDGNQTDPSDSNDSNNDDDTDDTDNTDDTTDDDTDKKNSTADTDAETTTIYATPTPPTDNGADNGENVPNAAPGLVSTLSTFAAVVVVVAAAFLA